MNKTDLHILMLEDEPLDAELNKSQLQLLDEYNCIVNVVGDKKSYLEALESSTPDIILSDYNLPQYTGLDALNDLRSRNSLLPFIFVTGTMSEETAVGTIKAGAWDYVVKDRLFRLPLAVRSVLQLKEERLITERAEEKVKRLLLAIEQTSAQIIVTNELGIIEYVNQKFTEVSGYSADEVVGKDARSLVGEPDKPGVNSLAFDKLRSGEEYKSENLNRKKDGTPFWEYISITPIKDDEGLITSYVAVIEDITRRKQMEEQLIEARDKAESSDKLKDAFLQNLSHEIRTPLNAIVGFSDLLNRSGDNGSETFREYTSIINESSHQLLSIVTDILTIASILTGQEKVNLKPVNINKLFGQLNDIFKSAAEAKQINLVFNIVNPNSPDLIMTDETKLTQILSNLLNNAMKFTHEGSVLVKYSIFNDVIKFYVIDSGIGISKESQDIIFDRFRQAEDSIHIEYGGTGLGLSISRSFAHMLGGEINVESELGQGSTFILTIPYSQATISDTIIKQQNFFPDDREASILIVDDEINNFILLKTYLKFPGITVHYAENGYEAVKICESSAKIDLVLMDIKMPVMDGVTAFEKIRALRKNLPIVAQTAYGLKEEQMRFIEIGFDGYIPKPIEKEELIALVKKCIIK